MCVQEFQVYKDDTKIKYKTNSGKIYTLAGYVYPEEFQLNSSKNHKNDYKKDGYIIEEAISTR